MPWTEITRPKYRRDHLRYASDTTDDEWMLIAPYMPAARTPAEDGFALGCRCDFLYRRDGLPMAVVVSRDVV